MALAKSLKIRIALQKKTFIFLNLILGNLIFSVFRPVKIFSEFGLPVKCRGLENLFTVCTVDVFHIHAPIFLNKKISFS